MIDLVKKAVEQFSMLQTGDTVTVALSGGADSVALLHALWSLRDELGITVNAAHLNHSIRGKEADRDQNFAKEFCDSLGIELFSEKIDVPEYAQKNHLSLELAAREMRYDFLNRVAKGKIATAHTATDNLETVIFNLTRGTAIKGLCGIPPVRERIVRPVIFCTRENIEDYCKANKLSFVTDSTNLSDDYSRNKIRHNVLPVLKELNPSVEISVMRTAVSLSEDNEYLETMAEAELYRLCDEDGLSVSGFDTIQKSVAKRVIKKYFSLCFCDVTLENRHINEIYEICLSKGGKVNLPQEIHAIVNNDTLFFSSSVVKNTAFKVNITKIPNVNNLFSNNMLDCDKIVGELVVRTRLEGDKIRLKNRGHTKSLKKLFTECKIPLSIRNTLPVIADDEGVVWVHNIGVCQRCAVNNNTKNAYKIDVE